MKEFLGSNNVCYAHLYHFGSPQDMLFLSRRRRLVPCALFQTETLSRKPVVGSPCSRRLAVINRGLPRFIFQWIILLSHMYFTYGLSELRHQLTDTTTNTTTVNRYEWSEYGVWAGCSSTCGYGIQRRQRSCINQRNEFVDEKLCLGSSRQYRVCKTDVLQCPNEQCSQNTEEDLPWKVAFGSCQVVCYSIISNGQIRYQRLNDQWMPDGTLCTNSRGCDGQNGADQYKSVCLQGRCMNIGCDGVINSSIALDVCGVCGGDASTCQVISANFNGTLQIGYTDVVEIPIDAYNIRVYEIQRSRNYLAISDETGLSLLNGDYNIDNPGRYKIAGTTVKYKRCGTSSYGDYEEITIQRHINTKIIILIVNAQKQSKSHIAYQYSLPLPPQQRPYTTLAPIPTSSNPPDEKPSITSTKQPMKEEKQDLQNGIADEDTNIDSSKQGTIDVIPLLHLEDDDGHSNPEHNVSMETAGTETTAPDLQPKQNTSSDISTTLKMETTDKSMETKQGTSQDVSEMRTDDNTFDDSLMNLLPASQNSSFHQAVVVAPQPADMLLEPAEIGFDDAGGTLNPKSAMWKGKDADINLDDSMEISGYPEDGYREDTTVSDTKYSYKKLLENNKQNIPETSEIYNPLDIEEQTTSTVATTSKRPSPSTGPSYHLENDVFDIESVDSSNNDKSSSKELISVPTSSTKSFLTTLKPKTVTEETVKDAQEFPFEFDHVDRDVLPVLFGDISQVMELVNPSQESQQSSVYPSAAATSIIISRGDIPMNEPEKPWYLWQRTGIAPCSATCARGISRSYAYCTNNGEQVPDNLCDPASKPEVVEKECGGRPCKPRWAVGTWSHCTVSCDTGWLYRTVHCWLMIAPGLDTSVSNSYCNQSNVPESIRSCTLSPCGPQWQTSDWSECSVECGEGLQSREVRCSSEEQTCNPQDIPVRRQRCMVRRCPNQWTASKWSQCPGPCRVIFRRVNCVNEAGIIIAENACPMEEKLLSAQLCGEACRAQWVPQVWGPCRGECGSTVHQRQVVCARTSAVGGIMQVLMNSVCASLQKPATESDCALASCEQQRHRSGQWFTTPWSQCPGPCRVIFRRVNCVNEAGIIIAENACPMEEKLLSAQLCGEACYAQWVPQVWGPCRGECGSTVRQRQIVCARTSAVGGIMQVLMNSVCASLQKPATESGCQLPSCPRQRRRNAQWFTTPWSQCSVSCGTGQRTRQIHCQSKRNQQCNNSKKPPASEPCALGDCPAIVPACSDSPTANCEVIRQANLCRYESYKRSCCLSCSY